MKPLGERLRPAVIALAAWQLSSGLLITFGRDGLAQQAAFAAHLVMGLTFLLAIGPYLAWHVPRVLKVPRPGQAADGSDAAGQGGWNDGVAGGPSAARPTLRAGSGQRALGLAAGLIVFGAASSGAFLLWRALSGLATPDAFRDYHNALGFVGAGALVLHLAVAARTPGGRAWVGGAARAFAGCAMAAWAIALGLTAGQPWPVTFPAPGASPPWIAAPNRSCGVSGCHSEIFQEWEQSAHGGADADPYFRALEAKLVTARMLDAVADCNECHDPVMLLEGRFARWRAQAGQGAVPHTGESVACVVCHAMSHASGNRPRGNYTVAAPRRALGDGTPLANVFTRAFPDPHRAAFGRQLYERSRLCAGCHRADVSQAIPGFGLLRIENPHARWALDGVKPTCQECHMPRTGDSGRASHRFPGSSMHFTRYTAQSEAVRDLVEGRVELPTISGAVGRGPLMQLSVGTARATTGGVTIPLAIRHPGRIGHQFPAGAQDLVMLWVEGELRSDAGTVLARWGEASAGGPLEPGTPVFRRGGLVRGPDGPVEVHPPWELAGVPFPVLTPLETRSVELAAPAAGAHGGGTLTAKLCFRKLSAPAVEAIGLPFTAAPIFEKPLTLAEGTWEVRW